MEQALKSRRVKIAFAVLCLLAVVAIFSGGANSVAAQTIPTATASILQFPTATMTQIGGPTATPSRTPTLTPVSAQALGTPTNLRSGPGLNFDIVGVLSTGDTVPIIGRSVTFPWYVVAWAEGPNGQAWVFAQLVQVIGDITTVPVIDPPEVPTTDPTRAILDATATAILQTPGGAETVTAQAFFLPTGIYTVTPGGGYGGGILPTFTAPPPIDQIGELPPPPMAGGGIAPAVIIIALGALGLLMLGLGLLRRMF